MSELTEAFSAHRAGDGDALKRIYAFLYPDLVVLARSRLRGNARMTLLDTSELVHECYLRFLNARLIQLENRAHFFAYCARVMRSIIVDFARARQAERRGGEVERVMLNTAGVEGIAAPEDQVLELAEAVDDLSRLDERLASVVEMRYFGGFSELEIAEFLGLTDRTVRRDIEKARLLLASTLR